MTTLKKNHFIFLSLFLLTVSLQGFEVIKVNPVLLGNGVSWEDWCTNQEKTSTCASHATISFLCYMHGETDMSPNYLHKCIQKNLGDGEDYNKGLGVEFAMEFARDYGVPSLSNNNIKYSLKRIQNIFKADWQNGKTKVEIIKDAIRHDHLVITGTYSLRGEINIRNFFRPIEIQEDAPNSEPENKGHALVFYAYSDEKRVFLIKNSWGEGDWATMFPDIPMRGGNAELSYEYVEEHTYKALVGFGKEVLVDKDKETKNLVVTITIITSIVIMTIKSITDIKTKEKVSAQHTVKLFNEMSIPFP